LTVTRLPPSGSQKELGGNAIAVVADIAKEADVDAAVAVTLAKLGRVDVLINNAGIGHKPQSAELVGPDEFDRIVGVNIRGIYLMTRALFAADEGEPGRRDRQCRLDRRKTGRDRILPGTTRRRAGWCRRRKRWPSSWLPSTSGVVALNPVAGETPLLTTFMGEDSEEIRKKFPRLDSARPAF
jgi:3-oxoacyl-[acyl-carrier protein] reductase